MGAREESLKKIATEHEIRSAIADLRDALKNGPQRPNTWGFYSNKNNELLTLIGDVTFIQAVLLEGDPTVVRFSVVADTAADDNYFTYGRDLLVDFEDGSRHWYLCGRYESLVKRPGDALSRNMETKKEFAAKVGAEFYVRTERDFGQRMTEFRNWMTLSATMTRARDFSSETELRALYGHLEAHGKTSIKSALSLPTVDPALMLAAIAKALANGQISSDLLKKQLSLNTEIWAGRAPRNRRIAVPTIIEPSEADQGAQAIPRNRRTAAIPVLWQDLSQWPEVNVEQTDRPAIYRRNKNAVEMYLAGRSFNDIEEATGLREDWVRKLFKKCLKVHSDARIYGFRGCVHYGCDERSYTRVAPLPPGNMHEANTGGYAGALSQLFDRYPDQLLDIIESYVLKLRTGLTAPIPEARISWKNLHKQILSALEKVGVKANEYPFNTRDQGYAAMAAIGRSILFKKPIAFIKARMGKDAARRGQTGKGISPLINANGSFQIAQLDFHKHDSAAVVEILNPRGGSILAPVPRWWIGCVVDEFNEAILGSSDSFEKQTTQSCVMDLVDSAIAPEEANDDLKSYRVCKDGLWLPHQLLPSYAYHGWDVLKLDRAWAHFSTNFLTSLIATIGCAVCFSRPRAWWARNIVERTFLELTRRGSQRLPTTYGTGPSDTKRDEPEENAIKLHVKRDDICLLARSIIREINEHQGEGTFWESAMNSISRSENMPTYFPRPLPNSRRADRPTNWITVKQRVEANAVKGIAPSVREHRCRFSGTEMSEQWCLVGDYVYLQVNRRDIREARIIKIGTGECIGQVRPEHKWMLYKVSWQNFLLIQKYGRIESARNRSDDPVEDFLRERTHEVVEKARKDMKGAKTAAAHFENVNKDKSDSPSKAEINAEQNSWTGGDQQKEQFAADPAVSRTTLELMMGPVPKLKSHSRA